MQAICRHAKAALSTRYIPIFQSHSMAATCASSTTSCKSLTDLPPELLDHITAYLPTAASVAHLNRSNKSLHVYTEKDAWATFNRTRFPSLCPTNIHSQKDAARTLTTLSKAWDRRAFVARYIEPSGSIRAFPGDKIVDRWKRPRGQTIGFTPHIDVGEQTGNTRQKRTETLAYSAGAEVCVRQRRQQPSIGEDVRWLTYRPFSAREGVDDITTLHLLRSQLGTESIDVNSTRLIIGTANGDLQLLTLPPEGNEAPSTYFVTQGQPVRSSSLLQRDYQPALLAAELGDSRICVYEVDATKNKISPSSSIDIKPPVVTNGHQQQVKGHRAWSTCFLSASNLAVGVGPSTEPIHVYTLTQTGLDKAHVRKFSLQDPEAELRSDEVNLAAGGVAKKPMSSVYPIVPLPPSHTAAASQDGQVFLSGAYDGVVRLHDLRSNQDVEMTYSDPTDDSAIYSLLLRGQEKLVAGTSRHSLLKVFDMRLGAKCYNYLDAGSQQNPPKPQTRNWNLFLRPQASPTNTARGWGSNQTRRAQASSIYNLASPSPSSPHLYVGLENTVVELAFTSVLDKHPDPAHFEVWNPSRPSQPQANGHGGAYHKGGELGWNGWKSKEVLDSAMYEQNADMKLWSQKSLWETWRTRHEKDESGGEGLDERWKVG